MVAQAVQQWIEVEVLQRKDEACGIISLDLRAIDGSALPAFTPGAHIDVRTSVGIVRQYSLCNDATEQHRYRLGVLLAEDSRGGSRAVHEELHIGARLSVGVPRNLFPLVDESRCVKLIAGGIGITPLLSMAYALHREARAFELHVCARDHARVSFRDELVQWPDQVFIHVDEEGEPDSPRFDPQRDIDIYQEGRFIYTCGPAGFMEFVRKSALELGWPEDAIRMEHFGADVAINGEVFTVEARKSGLTVEVGAEQSIAEALQAVGVAVPLSCEQGICGMCITPVIEGTPEHRDMYLTDSEKAANDRMTICCSRAAGSRLVLDI